MSDPNMASVEQRARSLSARHVATLLLLGSLATALADGGARPLLDPTRPGDWQAIGANAGETADQPTATLRLQGIFQAAGERTALISGQRVAVGDQVGTAEVLSIDNDKVTLNVDGKAVELASAIPTVKSPAGDRGNDR